MEIMTLTGQTPPKTLLWVDDDAPRRFFYESIVIESSGAWQIEWAQNPEQAARHLATRAYRAVILDQLMPLTEEVSGRSPWAAYLLLCWLRDQQIQDSLEPSLHLAAARIKRSSEQPVAGNKIVPVLILSALDDKQVERMTRQVNKPFQANMRFLVKPIDINDVVAWLDGIDSEDVSNLDMRDA
jgi:CheY-like chemotaxis protein